MTSFAIIPARIDEANPTADTTSRVWQNPPKPIPVVQRGQTVARNLFLPAANIFGIRTASGRCWSCLLQPSVAWLLRSAMSYQDPLLAYLPDRPPGKRRRAKKHSDLNTDVAHADTWHKQYQVYQDWRDKSATLQRIRNNAFRFQQTCDAVKRGLQQAQSQIADQVDSSRDAVVIALKQQLRAARSKLRRALQQQQQQRASEDCLGADLAACSKCVRGSKQDSQSFALGILVFGALAFVCGSAPWMLPGLYLAFASVALPWRFQQFYRKRLTFFLLDFCYVGVLLACWCTYFTDMCVV